MRGDEVYIKRPGSQAKNTDDSKIEPESTDDIIRKMRSGEFREIYGGSLKMWDRVADRLEAAVKHKKRTLIP